MTNVIKFPNRHRLTDEELEQAETEFRSFEERISSLSEILDLNVQGMYQVIDIDAEEIMMALLQMAALWSVRADIEPEEFLDLVRSIHLEISDAEET